MGPMPTLPPSVAAEATRYVAAMRPPPDAFALADDEGDAVRARAALAGLEGVEFTAADVVSG